MRYIATLLLALSVAVAHAAADPNRPAVPPEVAIFKVQWLGSTLFNALCTKRHPERAAIYAERLAAYRAELKRAEAAVVEDAAAMGALGERYLAAMVAAEHAPKDLDAMEGGVNLNGNPTLEMCEAFTRIHPVSDHLRSWRGFVRKMETADAAGGADQK